VEIEVERLTDAVKARVAGPERGTGTSCGGRADALTLQQVGRSWKACCGIIFYMDGALLAFIAGSLANRRDFCCETDLWELGRRFGRVFFTSISYSGSCRLGSSGNVACFLGRRFLLTCGPSSRADIQAGFAESPATVIPAACDQLG
jgi:hypothetical protein